MSKQRKVHGIGKRFMSGLVALTMAAGMVPGAAMAVSAEFSDKLVASLADLYDGDTARAREELEALYEAGVIDENGDMVELDIKEDGETISLDDLMAKIANEEEVGDITVNGHASTTEQIAQIQSVKTALEVAKMLAQDVEITDEHVENLESLIQGISDGTVDINSAIQSGTLSVEKQTGSMKSLADGQEGGDFPATKTSTGEVEADADGNYTAPLISDSTYNGSYNFKLNDPANKTYYTDSDY